MKRVIVAAAALALSCPAQEAPSPPSAKPHAPKPTSAPGTVHLDKDSLRDLRLTTARARRWRATEEISAFGQVIAHEDAAADVSTPFPGLVERLRVPIGRRVRRGRALVLLRSAELGRARADVVSAAAQRRVAKKWLERRRKLVAAGVSPRRTQERARLNLDLAEAHHRAALAKLAAFGVGVAIPKKPAQMARVTLRAPRDGTVTSRPVRRGAAVASGQLLYRVTDLGRVWLVAHVYEREAARLRVKDKVRATFPAFPGERLRGVISVLTGEVNPSTRTVPVRIAVRDKRRRLRPGMSATAYITLPVAREAVVTVPIPAVQRVESTWSVFLPRGNGRFVRRKVARGRDIGEQVEILKGLRAGEEVVVQGAFLLSAEAGRTHESGGHHH